MVSILSTEDGSLLKAAALLAWPLDPGGGAEGRGQGELLRARGRGEGRAGGVARVRSGARVWGAGRESRGAVTGLGLRVSELVSHLMLLHVTLCCKSFTANIALERPFFGVAPHVNL